MNTTESEGIGDGDTVNTHVPDATEGHVAGIIEMKGTHRESITETDRKDFAPTQALGMTGTIGAEVNDTCKRPRTKVIYRKIRETTGSTILCYGYPPDKIDALGEVKKDTDSDSKVASCRLDDNDYVAAATNVQRELCGYLKSMSTDPTEPLPPNTLPYVLKAESVPETSTYTCTPNGSSIQKPLPRPENAVPFRLPQHVGDNTDSAKTIVFSSTDCDSTRRVILRRVSMAQSPGTGNSSNESFSETEMSLNPMSYDSSTSVSSSSISTSSSASDFRDSLGVSRTPSLTDLCSFTGDLNTTSILSSPETSDISSDISLMPPPSPVPFHRHASSRNDISQSLTFKNSISHISEAEIQRDLNFLSTCGDKTSTPEHSHRQGLFKPRIRQRSLSQTATSGDRTSPEGRNTTMPVPARSSPISPTHRHAVRAFRHGVSPLCQPPSSHTNSSNCARQLVRRSLMFDVSGGTNWGTGYGPESDFKPWQSNVFETEDEEAVYHLLTKYLNIEPT